MAKETYWFKHDYNSRSDKEMVKVRMKMGMAGIGLYWCIVEMLYEEGGYLLRSEYGRIAYELQTKEDSITNLIETYSLFQTDDTRFWSTTVLSRLATRADIRQKARDAIKARWGNTDVSHSNNGGNTNKKEKEKEKEKERGMEFSEDKRQVVFKDGSTQNLGQRQLNRMKEGGYEPHYIKKGEIE